MISRTSLVNAIKTEAYRLGFTLCGITLPSEPMHLEVFKHWIEAGRQAEMGYLATERAYQCRKDPAVIFPGVKSIIILGTPYRLKEIPISPPSKGPVGRIASYAWGIDYHIDLPIRMRLLGDFISHTLGLNVPYRGYTDTAPILERELAQAAGLGWIGKNSCLISPTIGSGILLSELFIDLDLEPDPPFIFDRCGSCHRCLDACPTGCIHTDRTLDAQSCISYLTIENKGPIPVAFRKSIGNWIFGCDICQSVCPWNIRFAPTIGDISLVPKIESQLPKLLQEISLTTKEFNQKFRHSAVSRARRRGYLRNVAISIGNSMDPSTIEALAHITNHEVEPIVRGAAAWAMRTIGGKIARAALNDAALNEIDGYVLSEITGTFK
jgi:epoxyqueuosine reductase